MEMDMIVLTRNYTVSEERPDEFGDNGQTKPLCPSTAPPSSRSAPEPSTKGLGLGSVVLSLSSLTTHPLDRGSPMW